MSLIADLLKEYLTLLGYTGDRTDMETQFYIDAALFLGETELSKDDAKEAVVRLFSATGNNEKHVADAKAAIAALYTQSAKDRLALHDNRDDIWRDFLEHGFAKLSSAKLNTSTDITLDDGTVVSATYAQAAAGSWYDRGDGVLALAVANTPYIHSNLGMYFEPPSTNLLLHSDAMDNAFYSSSRVTITADQTNEPVVSPTGSADEILETTDNGQHRVFSLAVAKSAAAADYYVLSAYVKPVGDRTKFRLKFRAAGADVNLVQANFEIGTGVESTVTSVSSVGAFANEEAHIHELANGWYRLEVGGRTSTEATLDAYFNMINAGDSDTFIGDVTAGAYLWGMQLEPDMSRASTLMISAGTAATRDLTDLGYAITADDLVPPGASADYSFNFEGALIHNAGANATSGRIYQISGESSPRYYSVGLDGARAFYRLQHGNVNTLAEHPDYNSLAPVCRRYHISYDISATTSNGALGAEVLGTKTNHTAITGTAATLEIGSRTGGTDSPIHGWIKNFSFGNTATIA